jgi:diguanylate cyclase (GGDEF)-like protein
MVSPDGSWSRNVDVVRSMTIEIVAAIFASAFLTSIMIALFMSVARTTLTATELWRNGLSISVFSPTLIGLFFASRMRQSLERLKVRHEKLIALAWIDALTGLLNREGFDAAAAAAFAEARRLGQPMSVLICDIDAFRGLNDKYGHGAGDIALRNLAQMLEESIGHRTSVLGRQGGDEFVILLPGVEAEEAVMIAEGLREVCEARALVEQDPAAKFTISVGAGTEATGASELGAVLRRADATLYRAKRAGGNQVVSAPTLFVQRQTSGRRGARPN